MAQHGTGVGTEIEAGAPGSGDIIASTLIPTLMSLEQYAHILGIPPVHFHQGVSLNYDDQGGCESVWFQYDWHSAGKASREALARAISTAEEMIAALIGFWPAPAWIEEETRPFPRQTAMGGNATALRHYPGGHPNRYKTVTTQWGYFIQGGRRAVDLIEAGAAVVYPVDRNDGFVTISATWTGTRPESHEVAVFAGTNTDPQFQIRHLYVQVEAGGTITITGRPAQFFLPLLRESGEAIDADEILSYLTGVNIYRVYNSITGNDYAPAEFGWQTTSSVDPSMAYGTLQARDAKTGIVSPIPAVWSEEDLTWGARIFTPGAEPHTVGLYYQAGFPLDALGRVRDPFARAIAALATALLPEPVCGCAHAEKMSGWWQDYPEEREQVSYKQLECPWSHRRGGWEAYKLLSSFWGAAGSVSL